MLNNASRLLVLIGRDTHSSEWVKWEIDTFKQLKNSPKILLMRVPGDTNSGATSNGKNLELVNWNTNYLADWLR